MRALTRSVVAHPSLLHVATAPALGTPHRG